MGAISLKQVLTSVNLLGTIDGITFEAFIIIKPVPKLWKAGCILRENSTIHQGEETAVIAPHLSEKGYSFSELEDFELEILEKYCVAVGRTKSDVQRELIRNLKTKKKPATEEGA